MPQVDYSRSMRWLRDRTERRRNDQRRRKRTYAVIAGGFLLVFLVGLPSLISHSPLAPSMIRSAAEQHGWSVSVASVRMGWITPLRLTGVEATGPSGETLFAAESVDTTLTVFDWMQGRSDLGTINVDAPRLETQVTEGRTRLEEDLEPFWSGPEEGWVSSGKVQLRDASLKIVDSLSGQRWRVDQLQTTIEFDDSRTAFDAQGVVTDPDGISGALQTRVAIPAAADSPVDVETQSEGVPLSLLKLAVLRFPQSFEPLPENLAGNLTGNLHVTVDAAANWRADAAALDLRNLVVTDPRWTEGGAWRASRVTLEGSAWNEGKLLRTSRAVIRSDAGSVEFDGAIQTDAVLAGRYLDSLVGEFVADVDLAALTASAPGLIPLREGVSIESGRVQTRISGDYGGDGLYRSRWNLQSQPVHAIVRDGSRVVFEPVTADVTLRPVGQWVSAENLHVRSKFGDATASGDLRAGRAQFNLDFGRLSTMLRHIVDLPETDLGGVASGNVRWEVDARNRWTLGGSATASNLAVWIPGNQVLRRPSLDVEIDAQGVWGGDALERLDRSTLKLSDPAQSWTVQLIEPVDRPGPATVLPLRVQGGGNLDALVNLLGPWMPESLSATGGTIEADLRVDAAVRSGRLHRGEIAMRDVTAVFERRRYDQSSIKIEFDGAYDWPSGDLVAKTMSLSGNAVSLAVQGEMVGGAADLELAYRADMSRLQGAVTRREPAGQAASTPRPANQGGLAANPPNYANTSPAIAQVAFRPNDVPLDSAWRMEGQVEGRAEVQRQDFGPWTVAFEAAGKNIQLLQPPAMASSAPFVGPLRNTQANLQPTAVWAEPTVSVGGEVLVRSSGGQVSAKSLRVSTQWIFSELSGQVDWNDNGHDVRLQGPARIDARIAGERVTTLLGEPIQLAGVHQTPLQIRAVGGAERPAQFEILGSVGWDSGHVAGVNVGSSKVPLRVTETTVFVDPATVPLDQGQLNVAGEVHYRPGQLWFEQRPGLFAQGISLTPDMCRSWMKYMMPLAAEATDVGGSFSVELDECVVIPSDPMRTRVVGNLLVEGAAVGPGPLATRLITSVEQIEAAAKGLQGVAPQPRTARPWIEMEPQTVDFSLINGQVTHQRMRMRMGKAELISSGNVALDGRLDLRVQIPLQAEWLGSKLASLAGQQVTLPIDGTLTQPSLDTRAITTVLAQLGTQAVQANVENYLQRQVDKQFQKLFGK
ncbi:hypothetical protein [Candidatus Laterigemmans baculatus]|uniref:hypothetical protein n=1 Tax=Candidatus Laterigemmans baculatus TaxID=2770505 RepID=UPI0013D9CA3A|nr:hypothetical protein [Candidatus Laterigemmans baculatus]